MKKRIELSATILIDVDVDVSKDNWKADALRQIGEWMDEHLDVADGIDLDENNTRVYPDWTPFDVGESHPSDDSVVKYVNFEWEEGKELA